MIDLWKNAVVEKVALAMHVSEGQRKIYHNNRPYHGFVLNEKESVKDYIFSDGTILHTEGECLFYLPKGSSYQVKSLTKTGCYAINFDTLNPIFDKPFSLRFRNTDNLFKIFKTAVDAWQKNVDGAQIITIHSVYEILLALFKEEKRGYAPSSFEKTIAPAVEKIKNSFANAELSVFELAKECNVSEVYLRKLFSSVYGVSPKEYILSLRIERAKQLLSLGDFTVTDVAYLCGYSDPCHFSREFKKRTGVSPSEYL